VAVDDADAVYPVRIDPTFSDDNGRPSGRGGGRYGFFALPVSGNDLHVGGDITTAGGTEANDAAKWNGSNWSALGSGLYLTVRTLKQELVTFVKPCGLAVSTFLTPPVIHDVRMCSGSPGHSFSSISTAPRTCPAGAPSAASASMNLIKHPGAVRLPKWGKILRTALLLLLLSAPAVAAEKSDASRWNLPQPREVVLGGRLGEAYALGVKRLGFPPYDSAVYLRSDFSFETNRIFVNYSGDISGRFMQIASLVSPAGQANPPALPELLQAVTRHQKADGHFGREVDWNQPLEPENSNAVLLPIFWGNSRLLVGLIEAYRAFGREDCLAAARRIGDFYLTTSWRFLDPQREPEYRMTGSYAAGYVTDYFPGIEGLALLYQTTHDQRYLRQAEQMADFFQRFDGLAIDHSHGNLVTHYGLLLLYEITGKSAYLQRSLTHWQKAVTGGFVWPTGGIGERFHVSCGTDEGCSEADWLRLNLRLWELTGETRFLDQAERLLWNHYAMNRTDNGGYGHHQFTCDAEGPLLMRPQFTEAVWCCTFHGLLGLHTLKRYVVAGSPRGLFVNFPLDAIASVPVGRSRWKVSVATAEPRLGALECRVSIEPSEGGAKPPDVFVRRPAWAASVAITDRSGRTQHAREEQGYLRLSLRPGAECQATITFSAVPRVEDRRMRPVMLNPKMITRQAGVTLAVGPRLLMANADKPRPTLVVRVGPDGRLQVPPSNRFPQVENFQVPEATAIQAAQSSSALQLAPWDTVAHDAAVALVFDLIAIPEDLGPAPSPAAARAAQSQFFSKKEYTPHALPVLAAVRDQLPAPVCDAKPLWIQTYWKAWELAFRNFHEPAPGSGYVSQFIDAAFNQNIFLWDTCFLTMFCNVAHPLVPGIGSLDNFYAKQHVDGEICREIDRKTGLDYTEWVNREGRSLFSRWGWNGTRDDAVVYRNRVVPKPAPVLTLDALNHPIFAWAELESVRVTGDSNRLAAIFEPLVRYHDALEKYLRQGNGLYTTDWASMDNSPRNAFLRSGGCGLDISAEMVLFERQLSWMATFLGNAKEARRFAREADSVAALINRQMWDPARRFYFDLTPDGHRAPVKTIAAYWTLLARVARSTQAAELTAQLRNRATFGRLHRVPTLAADEPGYEPAGGYWRGAVWAPTDMMVIRGLENYGRFDLAREIAIEHLDRVAAVFELTGTIWENYAPDSVSPGKPAKGDFVGWSGLGPILFLLEYGIGLKPDALRNELSWDLRGDKATGCKRYRFNGRVIDLIATPTANGKSWHVTVRSDGAFLLRLRAQGHEKQYHVVKGESRYVCSL